MLQFKRYFWFVGLVILFRACIGFLEMQTLVSLRSPLSCKFHVNFFCTGHRSRCPRWSRSSIPSCDGFSVCKDSAFKVRGLSTEVYKILLILVEVRCYACFVKLCMEARASALEPWATVKVGRLWKKAWPDLINKTYINLISPLIKTRHAKAILLYQIA